MMDVPVFDGKLIIFTSFYRRETISPYAQSLMATTVALQAMGIQWDYWPAPGDFHVERAINNALTQFAQDEKATHFLNIDADHSWTPESVIRLLLLPEPVVCASYPMTGRYDQYTGVMKVAEDRTPAGKLKEDGKALIEATRIPAGFMRIRKEVVQDYIANHPEDWFLLDERKTWRFFWNAVKNHEFVGMDYAWSDKMTAMGYQLWIDPTLEVDHWGIKKHAGNLDKHLRELKAFQDVKTEAEAIGERRLQGDRGV